MERVIVVIPAYNEEATIREIVESALKQSLKTIIVDDGSTDNTAQLLVDLHVKVLHNHPNQGKAASLLKGIDYALREGAEAIITLDADGQHRPEDIPLFLEKAKTYPNHIIIGSRLHDVTKIPPLRLFANRMANFWISWASGYRIKDSQCGFRLYPATLMRQIHLTAKPHEGFVFESEILIEAAKKGVRVVNIPIRALYKEVIQRRSYYRPAWDTFMITLMVARKLLARGLYLNGLWNVIINKP
ncbi:MAG: glycosyl transferase family 2 [Rickettsiales bacterium]|jgi:glycosyltransferase involved in cell wall biosynthesis|nr:glycosyl transferase family 2 [Rickettsiales bacterium]